jgi:hypothetical protein
MTLTDSRPPVVTRDAPPAPQGWPRRLRGGLRTALVVAAFVIALAAVAAAAALLSFPHVRMTVQQHVLHVSWLMPAAAVAALAVLVGAWHAARRLVAGKRPASLLTVLAAADASVGAATGMWVFFGSVLHFSVLTRVPIFSFLEIATIAFALRARDNLLDSAARARAGKDVAPSRGLDGVLMWVCTATSAVLSSMASVSAPEVVFRLATPLIAAILWESGLSAEYHRQSGRQRKTIHWRFTFERLLVWAGVADPAARDINAVAADRRITQAAVAIVRARQAGIPGWRALLMCRAQVRIRLAEEHVGLAGNEDLQILLLQKIAVLDNTRALVAMPTGDPWQRAATWAGGQDEQKDKPRPKPGGGGGTGPRGYAQVVEELTAAIPAALARNQDAACRVHAVLAGRDDYPALCRALARNAPRGAKRMMAAIALYAAGDLAARTAARDWIAGQVPGQAGEVDRAEIRIIAQALGPVWEAERYPGQAEDVRIPLPAEGGAS